MSYLNEQIRLLITLQKKTKQNQNTIAKELKEAYVAINKIKVNLALDEVDMLIKQEGGQEELDKRKYAVKSQ